jgi:hypothetical protein
MTKPRKAAASAKKIQPRVLVDGKWKTLAEGVVVE